MKLKITSAMTFAGKQYENYRPEITVEIEQGATPEEIKAELDRMEGILVQSGADWKKKVLS